MSSSSPSCSKFMISPWTFNISAEQEPRQIQFHQKVVICVATLLAAMTFFFLFILAIPLALLVFYGLSSYFVKRNAKQIASEKIRDVRDAAFNKSIERNFKIFTDLFENKPFISSFEDPSGQVSHKIGDAIEIREQATGASNKIFEIKIIAGGVFYPEHRLELSEKICGYLEGKKEQEFSCSDLGNTDYKIDSVITSNRQQPDQLIYLTFKQA